MKKEISDELVNHMYRYSWISEKIGINTFEERFKSEHDGQSIVVYLNQKLKALLELLRREHLSSIHFDDEVLISFYTVLSCKDVDKDLILQISHQLYGADERRKK